MKVLEHQIYTAPKPTAAIIVRGASAADVDGIVTIVRENARQGHLLPRSADSIRATITTWLIAEIDGQIVACGSLLEMNPTLVEVRSLAVLPAFQSYGIGGKLVRGLVARARERGYRTAFALTRAVHFFERLGFSITNKERFPEKVWRDCVICPLQHACDETAVVLELDKETRRGADKEN